MYFFHLRKKKTNLEKELQGSPSDLESEKIKNKKINKKSRERAGEGERTSRSPSDLKSVREREGARGIEYR